MNIFLGYDIVLGMPDMRGIFFFFFFFFFLGGGGVGGGDGVVSETRYFWG